MKIVLFIFLIFVAFLSGAKKKEPFYPSHLIPDSLKENANTVIRNQETVYEIHSVEKIELRIREIITVLNSNGDKDAVLYLPYDPKIKPTIKVANFYNKNGELFKKVKNSDIYDQCYFDGFSLFNDARFKRITPLINNYPYTVEYEYSLEFDGLIDYPDWRPVSSFDIAVEKSICTIKASSDVNIRFKEKHILAKVNNKEIEGSKTYFWEITDFKAIDPEPYSVSLDQIVPNVKISPVEFSYYNHDGKLDTWANFGKWSNSLLAGMDELPDERIHFLKELIKSEKGTFSKVKKVYELLQKNTRYVSVQLGIGGYQPFPASTVDEVGYGDCKALTNYMKAMLAAIGIDSYYTLIKAGNGASEIDPNFPSQVFNHVILTVPIENDTVFLECTDQFAPCGYLGGFTSDRYALLTTKDGGRLIRTKQYDEKINTWNSNTKVLIENSGKAFIKERVKFNGMQYDFVEDELRKTKEKQIESEYENSKLSGAKFLDITYSEKRDLIPNAERLREIEVEKFATTMGTRMFLPVNELNKTRIIPKKEDNRKLPFELKFAFCDNDTVLYKLPDGYTPEFIPKPITISNDFGEYHSEINIEDNRLTYIRGELRKTGIFPPEQYPEYVDFRKQVVKQDGQKVILKKL